jgi:CHASE3 domain sensor protein
VSVYARLRILISLSVLVIGASVWLIAGQQRGAVISTQGQLRASGELLTAMLDQETGLRGYANTGEQVFLEPYRSGLDEFEAALLDAKEGPEDPKAARMLQELTSTARQWQANARTAVDQVELRGKGALSVDEAFKRKELMDRFRRQSEDLRAHVEQRAQDELQHARWVAFVFVMVFGAATLALGMLAVERQARRDAAKRQARREFIEALQGADDEREAKELLRLQVERSAPGSVAVVLTRNTSGNSLDAATDPSGVPGLGEALAHATPRSCLAIRRGQTYERKPDGKPLQACELCQRVEGRSVCVPSLVGGEVIGSLLVAKPGRLAPADRDAVAVAVAQAAPVLGNLRNLALAEHRAATDPLTKLPNSRAVQETLIRMVAQSQRSGTPLSAIVLSALYASKAAGGNRVTAATLEPDRGQTPVGSA